MDRLRAFAQDVLADWPESGPDLFDLQELAEKHGLLVGTTVDKPCREEGCHCAEYGDFPQTCYRRSALLTGSPAPTEQGHAKVILSLRITDAEALYRQAMTYAVVVGKSVEPLRHASGEVNITECVLYCLSPTEIEGCDLRYTLVHVA